MVEPFVSNVMSNKYDTALDFHITMYDELPYQRDADYCGREQIAMHSKRLLKYYLYMYEDISIIDNGDDEIENYLDQLRLKGANQAKLAIQSKKKQEKEKEKVPEEQQIQSLLDDAESPAPPSSDGSFQDPFAGVEDW